MSHSRWESSSGDARLQTALQPSLCSVLQEHHVRSQLWWEWMFHPAVSPSSPLTCICLSPVASHLSSLPAAVTAQLLHFPRAGRIGNECRSLGATLQFSSSTEQGCQHQLRHSQRFSPQPWNREAGGCTSVLHT